MNFYQRLKDVREDKDLKQSDIAKILEINQTQYSRYELGKQMMGIDKYIKLAQFYNISVDYLCGIIDEPRKLNKKYPLQNEEDKKQQKLILLVKKYEENPEFQKAIDKLLDIK